MWHDEIAKHSCRAKRKEWLLRRMGGGPLVDDSGGRGRHNPIPSQQISWSSYVCMMTGWPWWWMMIPVWRTGEESDHNPFMFIACVQLSNVWDHLLSRKIGLSLNWKDGCSNNFQICMISQNGILFTSRKKYNALFEHGSEDHFLSWNKLF